MDEIQAPIIEHSEIAPSSGWLKSKIGNRTTMFAWPPFQGTHQECYEAIAKNKSLVPAEGIDLALLANGAYNQNTPQWKSVRENFRSNWVRAPNRVLLIPTGYIEGDEALSGILVERDIEGNGLSTKMGVPDLSSWKQNTEGVYVPNDSKYSAVFVPSAAYSGKPFEKDRVAHAHLTPEGAEILARTAKDTGLVPYNWLADRMTKLTTTEQRVSLLYEDCVRLYLDGLNWAGGRCGLAFGVSASREASAPQN